MGRIIAESLVENLNPFKVHVENENAIYGLVYEIKFYDVLAANRQLSLNIFRY